MSLNVVESTSYDVQNYSSVTWHSCVVFPFESCLISHTPFFWRLIVYDVTEYCLSYIYRARLCSTVRCRYDAVQFIANIHTALHWQQQGINQTWNSQEAPIPRPNGQAMGYLLWEIEEYWPRYDGAVLYQFIPSRLWGIVWSICIIWCYECSYADKCTYFKIRYAFLICTALSCGHK